MTNEHDWIDIIIEEANNPENIKDAEDFYNEIKPTMKQLLEEEFTI